MEWKMLHPRATPEMLGYLPGFLIEEDPRPAKEQFNDRYRYGGWSPFKGHTLDLNDMVLRYPGDPPTVAIAETTFRDERIIFFNHSWVAIVQKDGTYEIARMD